MRVKRKWPKWRKWLIQFVFVPYWICVCGSLREEWHSLQFVWNVTPPLMINQQIKARKTSRNQYRIFSNWCGVHRDFYVKSEEWQTFILINNVMMILSLENFFLQKKSHIFACSSIKTHKTINETLHSFFYNAMGPMADKLDAW
jgi:hypothetical protein